MKNEDLLPWAILAGAVIVYNLGGSLFEKLGLKESADGKAIKAVLNSTDSAFSPTYWTKMAVGKSGLKIIDAATASNWAKQVYDAGWGPGTDEAKIFGVIRGCKAKMDVSRIADAFAVRYNSSLVDFLADEFTESEMKQAIAMVNSLPATRTK